MASAVEICVESVGSAVAAWEGGADRVELCVDRACDGLTPSPSDVADACRALSIPVHVLIRPRAGDFVYSDDEFRRMRDEVVMAGESGASGVVIGMLHPDGSVDTERTAALIDLARPLSVTFHKAFDLARDPIAALDALLDLGVDRLLTSGQAPTAREGAGLLATLVERAGGRLAVMAGGGVAEADLPVLRASGLDEIHIGSSVLTAGRTDPARVLGVVEAWRRLCGGN
jgi:copper homeostasis protein